MSSSCPFAVDDIIVPKEPDYYERVYNIKYRVIDTFKCGIIVEPLIEQRYIEEIRNTLSKEIYELNCTLPSFISINAKVSVDKEVYIWDFEWEDYEVVEDGSTG